MDRCEWLVQAGWNEDGEVIILPCGAAVTWRDDGGWECSAGHEHTPAEVRWAEGWDYSDEDGVSRVATVRL